MTDLTPLPATRAVNLDVQQPHKKWLVQDLWLDQAVGIAGGEPKCFKTFLALDLAVAVASGRPFLRHFAVMNKGPVLLFAAEDALHVVRERLDGICAACGASLADLDIHVITAARLRLDLERDQQRLSLTVEHRRPVLLILDPFIRLHCTDENSASEIAPMLAYLRHLQRQFALAVLVVHHAKKGAGALRPGQALRGSSDLHGWGDSNLYLRRSRDRLSLTVEHRSAPGIADLPLRLDARDNALALTLIDQSQDAPTAVHPHKPDPHQRILAALSDLDAPLPFAPLRERCRIRAATLSQTLAQLVSDGRVVHSDFGYHLPA